jgi:hypothetical protein
MYGRLFLPAVFAMLIPVAFLPIRAGAEISGEVTHRWRVVLRAGLAVVLTAWMVFCAVQLRAPKANYKGIGDERGWYSDQAREATPVRIEEYEPLSFYGDGEYLKRRADRVCGESPGAGSGGDKLKPAESRSDGCRRGIVLPDKPQTTEFGNLYPGPSTYPLQARFVEHGTRLTAMRTAIGIRGFVAGDSVHLVDHVGLSDPLAARLSGEYRNRPGHRKALTNPWMIARFSERQPVEDFRITAARQALECPPLVSLDRAITAPLTPGQFVSNIWHAWTFWHLRLPRDPVKARQQFCGTPPLESIVHGGSGGVRHVWRCPLNYHLESMRVGTSPDEKALAFLHPVCAADRPDDVPSELATINGPRIGGHGSGKQVELTCSDGEQLAGFRGRASDIVHRLEPICVSSDTSASDQKDDEASIGFEKGESFEVRCETRAVGFAARTGILVDAAGVVCER